MKKHYATLMFIIFLLIFILLINFPDLCSLLLDNQRWVPVNTPPLAIGDDYHYFSILKLMAFGNHFCLPYDSLYGIRYLEISRIIPYLLNLPVYYLGSIFDIRYSILFVRLFDSTLLFLSMFYFIQTINHINGWKNNNLLSITSIFIIFYGFQGLNNIFLQQNIIDTINNFFTFFGYMIKENFIYNNSSINDLTRAIFTSGSAPIILYLLALRLRIKEMNLIKFIVFLLILAFTNFPIAIAFGMLSISLDIFNKVERYKITLNIIIGLAVGGVLAIIQTKLIFSMYESAKELLQLGSHPSFALGNFSAVFITFVIILAARKHLSIPTIITLIILSIFQPLAMTIGGEHGNRFWLRSINIPFFVLFIYLLLFFTYAIFLKYTKNYAVRQFILISITLLFGSIVIGFILRNTIYLLKYNERFIDDPKIISYLLTDNKPSIIITNSTQVAMLCQIYDPVSTPLMGHFSLQSTGYKESWAKTIVNFELLGIPAETIVYSINKEATQRHWLSKRESLRLGTDDFKDFYFDELLFASTYASYNHKMLQDKTMSDQKILQPSFYQMKLEKESTYSMIKNKKIVYIIDTTMPIIPSIETIQNRRGLVQFENYEIYDKDIN